MTLMPRTWKAVRRIVRLTRVDSGLDLDLLLKALSERVCEPSCSKVGLPTLKACQRPGEHRPGHRVGNLGTDVPTGALAGEAGEQLLKGRACR